MSHFDAQLVINICREIILDLTFLGSPQGRLRLPLPGDQAIYQQWLDQKLKVQCDDLTWSIDSNQLIFTSPSCDLTISLSSHHRHKLGACLLEWHQRQQLYRPFIDTYIEIYSLEPCRYCDMALEMLKEHGIDYHVKEVLNKSNPKYGCQLDALKKKFPDVTTFPLLVWKDGTVLGGYTELNKMLNRANLDSKMVFDAEF